MTPIEAALEEIRSLKLEESINYTTIARKFGVSRVTLSRHHRGIQQSKEEQYEKLRNLNNEQERLMVKYINEFNDCGVYFSYEMLREFAKAITGVKPGKHWPGRFLRKYEDQIGNQNKYQRAHKHKDQPEDQEGEQRVSNEQKASNNKLKATNDKQQVSKNKPQVPNKDQEKELVAICNKLTDDDLFISHEMIRNFARDITGDDPGESWSVRFLRRNKNQLATVYYDDF